MIFIEFEDGQGLGNQLWNYVTLRALSKFLGLGYKVLNPDKFKGKKFLDISYSSIISINNKSSITEYYNYDKLNIFNEKLIYDKSLDTFACDFDERILSLKPYTIIRGLFQSEKYLFNYDIKDFIKLNSYDKKNKNIIKKKCLLNIRGGEYKRFKNLILPKKYWLNAMENMKIFDNDMEFSIITDDYEYSSILLPEIEILKGDISEDFINLYKADYLIVSNSSFSYFPINLGNFPKYIIAPSNWSRFGNKENRWISPANFYKNWSYQNKDGKIISRKDSEKIIKETIDIYSTYNVVCTKESIKSKSLISFLPHKFRKLIKKIISKLFPLLIG